MGKNTSIEWASHSWNPFQGCTKVSSGCKHCYMFREKERWGQIPNVVTRSKNATFRKPLKWKEPGLVFTCSWSDWFHKDADSWRDEAWDIIKQTPHLTYQILTKRPERIMNHLPKDWENGYSNVWLGVTVEEQEYDYRIDLLKAIPAKIRFISAEPLIAPLDLQDFIANDIHWVIVGGESGPNCRGMELEWAKNIRDQCASFKVAYFLKQLGGHPDKRGKDQAVLDGLRWEQMPDGEDK